jgi:hypothetical protein
MGEVRFNSQGEVVELQDRSRVSIRNAGLWREFISSLFGLVLHLPLL